MNYTQTDVFKPVSRTLIGSHRPLMRFLRKLSGVLKNFIKKEWGTQNEGYWDFYK